MVPSYKGCLIHSWWYTTQDGHICTRAWGVGGGGGPRSTPTFAKTGKIGHVAEYLFGTRQEWVCHPCKLSESNSMSISLLLSLPSTVLPVICHCSFILIHHVSQTCLPQIVGVADFMCRVLSWPLHLQNGSMHLLHIN